MRKVNGAIKFVDEFVKNDPSKFLIRNEFTIADIAAGAMLGMMNMVETKFGLIKWKEDYPEVNKYWEMLEARDSFRETQPYMFELTEKVA